MEEVLDNQGLLKDRDPFGALSVAADEWQQLELDMPIQGSDLGGRELRHIAVAGMGGSALAAGVAKDWLDLSVPFEVIRGYELPNYVNDQSLVIASSYSGNTEETLHALDVAERRGAQIAVIAAGGKLIERAQESGYPYVVLPQGAQPRMMVFANLIALVSVLGAAGLDLTGARRELRDSSQWLKDQTKQWLPDVASANNTAKQLAWFAAGKSIECIAGTRFRSIAYKWKISFNENAKTVAFSNELPEFNHNEFIGWSSHPVEKPYAIFDLRSSYDHPRIEKRFDLTSKLLSGKRPQPVTINLQGEHMIQHMLWGMVLADFVSIYLAILNGVDPTKVDLVEKLKVELTD